VETLACAMSHLKGFEIHVASSGGQMCQALEQAGVIHHVVPMGRGSLWSWYASVRALRRLVRAQGISIVHAHSRFPAFCAQSIRRFCPLVTSFHAHYGLQYPWKKYYNQLMLSGDVVTTVSSYTLAHIHQQYPGCASKVHRVCPGLDFERLARMGRPDQQEKKMILMTGRPTSRRGYGLVLKALSLLKERADWQGVFLGIDPQSSYGKVLMQHMVSQGLEGRVTLVPGGTLESLRTWYEQAWLLVTAPENPESFGYSVAEAGACGCPALVPDQGGSMEIILPERTGWAYQFDHPSHMAQQINHILNLSPSQRLEIGHQAQQRIKENFAIEPMVAAHLRLYESLLSRYNCRPDRNKNFSIACY
jgi:glycosyltransferase involved in cell wall biosynthesis